MCYTGAIYLDQCPVQRFIPIYLVVGGVFGLYENVCGLVQSLCQQRDPERYRSALAIFCKINESLVGCFMLAWFIAGESKPIVTFRAKFHYTDTGYEHWLRTPPTDGQAHNNSTTNLPHRNAKAQHIDVSRCWDVANFSPLLVFVGGVCIVYKWTMVRVSESAEPPPSYSSLFQRVKAVSVGGVRSRCPCSGVWLLSRDYNCDSTTIRLRYDYDVSRALASIRRDSTRAKMNMSIFRRSRVVVVSQSNRTQIVIPITSVVVECVVVSSYRSRIATVI